MPGENLTRVEAQQRAATVRSRSYDVELDLARGDKVFGSRTTLRFDAEPGSTTFVDLIAPTVHSVTLNGRELDVADVFHDSRITLDGLEASNEVVVDADCAYMHTGEGLHRFVDPVDGEVYLYSQFEVADSRRVLAVFEQPDLKATFAFTVLAPSHWVVVSNSPTPQPEVVTEGDGHDGGTSRWSFEATPVLSSYVTAIIAGPYHGEFSELTSSDGRTIPLGVYCRASLAEHLDSGNIVDITKAGFAFYEEAFALPYPFAKYDQLFVPEFNAGAMENAGAVTFLENYVFRSKVPDAMVERRAVTILHELAHMWFGDLVTMRWWNDLWLNESFAEYASTLATAEATSWTQAWTTFSSLEKSWAYRQDQLPSTHPIVAEITDLEDVAVNFDGITYAKGASVLKQLVAWVGRDEFLAGVRAYFAKHAHGNTELRDLLAELEATSGRDLTAWSALWLEKAGVTLLRPVVETDDANVITSFAIAQEVPAEWPTQRPHRLAVGGYDVADGGSLVRRLRVELDVAGALTPVPELVGERLPDLVLVNDDDLAYAKVRLDDASLATALEHLRGFDDSLPRSLVWAAAWDMTRDGEWPATQFVDLVLRNIDAETDSTVVLVLLRQLAQTIETYVDPSAREEVGSRAAARLWELAQGAAPGSDAQLQLVKAYAARARGEEALAVVRGLLDGEIVLAGLAVDVDLRWELLTALAAGGAATESDVSAELERDATATGQRAAAAARAAFPTAQAKADVWAAVVEADELPNAVQSAVIASFGRSHDRSLLVPYVEGYFASLERIWAERTNEMAQNIVTGLYPSLLADIDSSHGVDVLAVTDTWLDQLGERTPALRRLVVEAEDGVRRALRVQAADRAYRAG
ncbi:aminopeptidase N [Beutenbergia cavernae DSM 12333]|uniref:Aminopeptidase N n=1 Tax=Beutenbergia cavernae (strain ATCC BAA-8 / DSM 12333 / CCUG 43141 / JCM 11478 / NBRC 16432 / NCIMB 13614 / HKI 0122) TaxID=471853 RepID=C5BXJ2_BEUC1|nr:aminopeptidase N [Beutenbergia cavernae]ACQ80875.1 aminopeptidase N [Beutenbergia cavernae DSM 12333]